MTPDDTNQLAAKEIRNTFAMMIGRLQEMADTISDELEAKSKIVQLEMFLAHSREITEPGDLLDFCMSTLTTMKCTIYAARSGRQGRSVARAMKGMQTYDGVNLSSILAEMLERLEERPGT